MRHDVRLQAGLTGLCLMALTGAVFASEVAQPQLSTLFSELRDGAMAQSNAPDFMADGNADHPGSAALRDSDPELNGLAVDIVDAPQKQSSD